MTGAAIRPLTAADAPVYAALRRDGVARFPGAFLVDAEEADRPLTPAQLDWLDSGAVWGAFLDGRLVGFVGAAPRPNRACRHRASVGPFYVAPEAQGTGIAHALLAAATEALAARGVVQLELWVGRDNARARAFYAREGYVERGVMPRAVIRDGVATDDLFLVRALDAP